MTLLRVSPPAARILFFNNQQFPHSIKDLKLPISFVYIGC